MPQGNVKVCGLKVCGLKVCGLKVCGLTRPEDVALCQELGVGYTGFIMAGESPRRITPAAVAAMPQGGAKRVGVFTTGDIREITAAMKTAGLAYAQLHGGQDVEACRALGPEHVIKVFWPERHDARALQEAMERFAPVCAFFLFDAGTGGGGSGRAFAWEQLAALTIPRPWFLAGGIGPENARKALAACSPDVLDVNSGVESAPGIKDAQKLRQVCTIIRNI